MCVSEVQGYSVHVKVYYSGSTVDKTATPGNMNNKYDIKCPSIPFHLVALNCIVD